MLVLALDTSTPAVTVALAELPEGGPAAVVAERGEIDPRRHAELLAPAIETVLSAVGAGPRDLGAIAVGLGPGPFTGLRVGIVTAAALADARCVPAYGVCSLDVVAHAHPGDRDLVVATDARRREVYWARYDGRGDRITGPHVDRPAVLADALRADERPVRLAGAGALLYAEAFTGLSLIRSPSHPAAADLARMVAPRAGAEAPGDALVPLYLRRPDVAEPPASKPVTAR